MSTLVFFHGLESGPHGSKYRHLCESFGEVLSPDFTGVLNIWERLRMAEEALAGMTDLVIVGSSFGGLLAVLFVNRHPEQVKGYLLCAPALHVLYVPIENVPPNAVIIHGTQDEVVPFSASLQFHETHTIDLLEVTDGHALANSSDLIRIVVQGLLEN